MSKPCRYLLAEKCATCPFREGSRYDYLAPTLAQSSLTDSRICHSTGSNAINRRTGRRPAICRGSRDLQLARFKALGLLTEATDAEWAKVMEQRGMTPPEVVTLGELTVISSTR